MIFSGMKGGDHSNDPKFDQDPNLASKIECAATIINRLILSLAAHTPHRCRRWSSLSSECEGGVRGAARSTRGAGAARVLQLARNDSEREGVHGRRGHWLDHGVDPHRQVRCFCRQPLFSSGENTGRELSTRNLKGCCLLIHSCRGRCRRLRRPAARPRLLGP